MHLRPLSLIAALALSGAISTTLPALEFSAPAANPTVQTSNDDQEATATDVIRYSPWTTFDGRPLPPNGYVLNVKRNKYVYSNKGVLLQHWIQRGVRGQNLNYYVQSEYRVR